MMNGQTEPQPQTQTYDGNLPVTLTLTVSLGNCQLLLQVLADMSAPWKVTNPLILEIQRQVKSILERTPSLESQGLQQPLALRQGP